MSERLGKWLIVEQGPSPSGKTIVFTLYPADRELTSALNMPGKPGAAYRALGNVAWYGPWRKYALYPAADTIFETDCLRAIADFCEAKTQTHREARATARRMA